MNRSKRAPFDHPLLPLFNRAVDTLTAAMAAESGRSYRGAARNFLLYLEERYPEVSDIHQLRRDPHVLEWLAHLRAHNPPLSIEFYGIRILLLRCIFEELAWMTELPELSHFLRREDVPRAPHRVPRALNAEQDQAIQQELRRRNDLGSNVILLLRYTGMRIGECVDLAWDCLHRVGPDRWAIHVPLGKLKTERMIPVDSTVCEIVHRLRFFRSFDPLPADGRLLARPCSRHALIKALRYYLHEVAKAAGIQKRIVPHQMRHTFATAMARAGVSLPVLMKLLGHTNPEMTMRYIDVVGSDLQREFHLARTQPRHLAPQPRAAIAPAASGLPGIIESLLGSQHLMELFRRSLPPGTTTRGLDRLSNRLIKIIAELRKLPPAG